MKSKIKRIQKIITAQFALLSFEFILLVLLGLGSLIVFIAITGLLLDNEVRPFDEKMYYWVRYYASGWLDVVMLGATFLGNRQFIIVFALSILTCFLFLRPHRWHSVRIAAVALGCIGVNLLMKGIFRRERPLLEHLVQVSGLSYPSGHAMFGMSFYGLLLFILWKQTPKKSVRVVMSVLMALLIFLVGTSRVYLGVHYASDVLAGFAAGFIWLVLSLFVLGKIEAGIKKKRKEKVKGG